MNDYALGSSDRSNRECALDQSAAGGLSIVNAMTVDVEDYFQVSAFERHVSRADWEHLSQRLEGRIDRILQIFSDQGVKGTFFTLGWVSERYPVMVRRIVSEGHELASHGWEHVRAFKQTQQEFRADVTRTKLALEDAAGCSISGYRAASYSIGHRNLWALQVLDEAGYRYSSSIYPIRHDLYGMPDAPRFRFTPCSGSQFQEIPITTLQLGQFKIPCGGGGYFRLFPYSFSRWAMQRVNQTERQSCIFYFHPWEIDPGQPRLPGLNMKTRFRHYLNLHRMEARLETLLGDFAWGRMDEIFLAKGSNTLC